MSLTRKAPAAAKTDGKPKRQDLVQALAERDAELAEARRQNKRLFDEVQAKTRDLEEALEQQAATGDVLKIISGSPALALPEVLQVLIVSAVKLCADDGVIYLKRGDVFVAEADFEGDAEKISARNVTPRRPGRESVTGRVALSGQVEQIPDNLADPEFTVAPALRLKGIRSMLGVPLLRGGEVAGVFVLGRRDPGLFSDRAVEQARTFADQAVIAIENARLFNEVQDKTRDLQESLAQQTATANVLKVISRSAFDLQAVFDTLVRSAVELVGAAHGTIHIREGDVYAHRASFGFNSELLSLVSRYRFSPGRETLAGRVALSGVVESIPDVLLDSEYLPSMKASINMRSLLGVPLLRADRVEGMMILARDEPGDFTPRQIELVETFADQASIAIENVRLFDEVQAKTRDLEESLQQQTATADVLKVISRSAFDLQAVFDTLIASAVELSGSHSGAICVRDGEILRYRSSSGPGASSELHNYLVGHPANPGRGSIVGRAVLSRQIEQIPDIREDSEYSVPINTHGNPARALVGVPLLGKDRVEGAIVLMRLEPGAFPKRQTEILQTFVDQAVIAIENARLFDEVQAKTRDLSEALEQQTASAEILRVISSSPTDVRPVFETIVRTARKLCDAERASVHNLRDGAYHAITVDGPRETKHDESLGHHPILPGRGSVTGRVVEERNVVHIHDVKADPEFTYLREDGFEFRRTMLGVPLLRDGQVIGVIVLQRPVVQPFTKTHIDLVTTFADQAVIAIENVRLFDEVQAKTRDLEESLQQQTATADVLKVISRSAFDLQAVLTTLAESARELCGASFVTLFMRDGEEMRLRAESGCTPEIVAFLHAHPIKAGRETFTGRVMLSGEAVHLPDVLADPQYDFGDAPRIGNYRALLGVPLLRDGQVEGVFALARPVPAPFTARQIEMVRAFADQAVIAIENSRLFEEVQARTRELAASLDDLRKAQDRLIQSEKLASLGQLTAGIAHEIKNPLNFINNYSALSRELIDELAEAIKGRAANEAAHGETDELLGAIGGNLDKIVQHGKRADSIVKNMLLHSREGSGERSTTNVNAMVEEALNLAYHGARAEKPGFNVTIVKSLDPNAGAAEVYAQEMTRVLLNLISNGFYATSKRKQSAADGAYEPTISASTRDLGPRVEIAIRDNGTGIPDEVKAKMFNPFFTTKPAGEGTGLGLSLSHDIVVKQHGGAIEVSTEPDAFTEFTIVLPRGAAQI